MPELPEVEHLRRSLEPWLVGGRLGRVVVRRRSVVEVLGGVRERDLGPVLLANSTVVATHRHGKQMAIESDTGAVLVVQLGMTGSVTIERGAPPRGMPARHRHVLWDFMPAPARLAEPPHQPWRLAFRDPRRFGGLTAYPSLQALQEVWATLGPDALTISSSALHDRLATSARPIKSSLLDQGVLAGVGNIYADEALFASKIHPLTPARQVSKTHCDLLASSLRRILRAAVEAGGSTLRDYRDAFGEPGDAVQTHQAYGRSDQPCFRCRTPLVGFQLSGRTTVYCPNCQTLSTIS
jgi:formamidopyrimidine-DNA glycosylase